MSAKQRRWRRERNVPSLLMRTESGAHAEDRVRSTTAELPPHARRRRRQRGATLAEFAIVLPLFLTMLLGMLDYGYFFYVGVTAAGAAREGARQCTLVALGACGACNPTSAVSYMGKVGMSGYTTATSSCASSGGTLMYTVDVSVDYPTLTGYMTSLGLLPASSTAGHALATAAAVMRGQ